MRTSTAASEDESLALALFEAALTLDVTAALALIGAPAVYLAGQILGTRPARTRVLATVLFTDIVGSTRRAYELGDRCWRELLEAHDQRVRRQVTAHGGRVLKSLGDGHLAMFDSPARAIQVGRALGEDAESMGLRMKVGVHTGELEMMGHDVAGLAVHIGARVMAKARPGEVLATGVVRDLVVGAGIEFADRGAHQLNGLPGVWSLFAVECSGSEPGHEIAERMVHGGLVTRMLGRLMPAA